VISMEDWITIRNLKKRNPKMGTRTIAKNPDLWALTSRRRWDQ